MLSFYLSILDSAEDEAKFEKLYNTHKRTMLYTAYNILLDHHLTEDAVHEAFIRIAKNFFKVGEINSTRTRYFAVVIARNAALTMLEKESKVFFSEEIDESLSTAELVEDVVLTQIEYDAIVHAIQDLSPTYKDILFLQYVEEYKLTEIAELLGLDLEVVKKRAQRGKKKLLEILNERMCGNENIKVSY